MPLFLLGESLLQRLDQLVEATHRFDHRLFFVGQIELVFLQQPFERQLRIRRDRAFEPFDVLAEDSIELVVMLLVLDQARSRKEIEVIETVARDVLLQSIEQVQKLLGRNRQAAALQA